MSAIPELAIPLGGTAMVSDFAIEELDSLDAPGFLGWDKETWAGFAVGAGLTAGILAT
jgi:hypothetical protein